MPEMTEEEEEEWYARRDEERERQNERHSAVKQAMEYCESESESMRGYSSDEYPGEISDDDFYLADRALGGSGKRRFY